MSDSTNLKVKITVHNVEEFKEALEDFIAALEKMPTCLEISTDLGKHGRNAHLDLKPFIQKLIDEKFRTSKEITIKVNEKMLGIGKESL